MTGAEKGGESVESTTGVIEGRHWGTQLWALLTGQLPVKGGQGDAEGLKGTWIVFLDVKMRMRGGTWRAHRG